MYTNRAFPAVLAVVTTTVLSVSLALGFIVNRADAQATHAPVRPLAAATQGTDGTDPWG